MAQTPLLRTAVGSMITGLQSMPSIAWFPLAILLFGLTEGSIDVDLTPTRRRDHAVVGARHR